MTPSVRTALHGSNVSVVAHIGLLLAMTGLLRARVVPWWPPVLVIAGGVAAGFVGAGIPALIGLGWSLAAGIIVVRVARDRATSSAAA